MNVNDAYPSKYMKADSDIPEDRDLIVTMDVVQMENVGGADSEEQKPILYFRDHPKGLVINKTNASTIAGMYSPETDNWTGKKIALFAQEVDFQGRQVLAIRVRLRKPQPAQPAQQARPEPVAQAAGGRGGRPAPAPEENEAGPFSDDA